MNLDDDIKYITKIRNSIIEIYDYKKFIKNIEMALEIQRQIKLEKMLNDNELFD